VDRFITGFTQAEFHADGEQHQAGSKEYFLCSHKGILGWLLLYFVF
jgi:hypothetical protein